MYKEVTRFLSEVRAELSKVTWPKYDEWVGATLVVLMIVVAFAIYLGIIDSVFTKLATFVFKSYGLVGS